jgi:hypothetical protein
MFYILRVVCNLVWIDGMEINDMIQMTVKTQQFYYNLLLQGHTFRLLRVIIRPSNEWTQDYQLPSALRDPVALTVGGVIVV